MKKNLSLIKAAMSEGMNIFKISTKNKSKTSKILLPILLAFIIMSAMGSYAETTIEMLEPVNMQFVVLTLFILATSLLTLIEGIYKSGNLLFDCKDDNLLLSLPLKKTTIVFLRMFKFYVFELLFNSIFLIPAIVVYIIHIHPGIMFYVVSLIGLFLFPIVPILASCILGFIITSISSRFKGKNIVQTIISVVFLIGVLFVSYNTNNFINNLSEKAVNLNEVITKVYYPAGTYIELILNFNIVKLLEFLLIHLGVVVVATLFLGRFYFKINSNAKSIKIGKSNSKYTIKSASQTWALIKKELSRFINSTVFVTNAGFGLVLFILGCVLIAFKYEEVVNQMVENIQIIDLDYITNCLPVIMLGLVGFSGFMTCITCSMISLEGKSFNILKSLPVKPYTIVKSKVLTAILIMIPFFLIGDLIIIIKFGFDIISIILLILASILIPLISETFGILINLKYPRMDAKNDTEVVKQSLSSAICVFVGMALTGINIALLYFALNANIQIHIIMLMAVLAYIIIYTILSIILHKTAEKSFNNILV